MSNEKQLIPIERNRNVPQLRFPEFKGGWINKKYSEIYTFYTTNSLSRSCLNYEGGEVKNIHYGDIHTKFSTLFDIEKENVPFVNSDIDLSKIKDENFCQEGDLLIADASEDYNDIGKTIEIININNQNLISGLHTFHARPNKFKMSIGFAGYLLQSWKVRKQIMIIAQGTKVLSLATTRLGEINLTLPQIPEQQKIASFLTDVDAAITKLTIKKSLLEQYKKGVMQKIFNQELRFKDDNGDEFSEWEERKLGEVGKIITGKTPSTADKELWGGDIQFVTPTDINEDKKYQKSTNRTVNLNEKLKVLPKHSIMYTCIASIGKMALSIHPCITNQQINSLVPSKEFNNEYIYYALLQLTPKIKSTQTNTTLPIINKTEFSKFKIFVPCLEEQTKIANFLSDIDIKIEALNTKIENSKSFKKGLLQKMFV